MLKLPVKIYYNQSVDAMLTGYTPGDKLDLVFDSHTELAFLPASGIDPITADIRKMAFAIFNGSGLTLQESSISLYRNMHTNYRHTGKRSMSVGDVIVIGNCAWSVAPLGWEGVDVPNE